MVLKHLEIFYDPKKRNFSNNKSRVKFNTQFKNFRFDQRNGRFLNLINKY